MKQIHLIKNIAPVDFFPVMKKLHVEKNLTDAAEIYFVNNHLLVPEDQEKAKKFLLTIFYEKFKLATNNHRMAILISELELILKKSYVSDRGQALFGGLLVYCQKISAIMTAEVILIHNSPIVFGLEMEVELSLPLDSVPKLKKRIESRMNEKMEVWGIEIILATDKSTN